MLSPAIAWILLLFDPPNVSADEHISKGYSDPRTLDNFTCGINTVTDTADFLLNKTLIISSRHS